MIVVFAGLTKDEAVFPFVDVLARLTLFDVFRGTEVWNVAFFTVSGEDPGFHALLGGDFHFGLGGNIEGRGQIIVNIAANALGAIDNSSALILHPAGHIPLLEDNGLFFAADGVRQRFPRREQDAAKAHEGHLGVALGDDALIALQVLETINGSIRHFYQLLFTFSALLRLLDR